MRRLRTRLRTTAAATFVPSLSLNFLSGSLDSRVTFSRGTTATFVGSNGLIQTAAINTPRFDYDPVTLAAKGLLIEEARTNLLLRSEEFNDAVWVKGNGTVSANTIASPDGTTNADAFIENTAASAFHYINQSVTKAASAIQYAVSFYIKNKGRQVIVSLQSSGSNGISGRIDPATGTITAAAAAFGTGWTVGALTMTDVGNGWYRVVMTGTSDTTTSAVFQLALYNGTTNVYTGDGVSGAYLYGTQLEAGAFATSYIPTVAATVTRSADIATMTGTDFSSWYNQSEGTFVANCDTTATATVSVVMAGSNDNNRVQIGHTGSTDALFRIVNSGSAANPANITATKSGFTAALAYQQSNAGASVNGSAVSASSPTAMVAHSALYLGANAAGGLFLNGHIRTITYYPQRLPNATLQALTS